jgi:hypothetical protein
LLAKYNDKEGEPASRELLAFRHERLYHASKLPDERNRWLAFREDECILELRYAGSRKDVPAVLYCPRALRDDNRRLYTLAGGAGGFQPRDRVRVIGKVVRRVNFSQVTA